MRTRRGGIMVLTLAVLTGLITLLAISAASQRVVFRAGLNALEQERAEIAAEAGVQYALAALVTQSKTLTKLDDDWAEVGQAGGERFVLGNNAFRMEIIDAGSRMNINQATREELDRVGLTDEQIDSLLDWREDGQTPRANGAKDEYYNQLDQPYNAKLKRFDSVEELLLVRGFTPVDLYEPLPDAGLIQPQGSDAPYLAEIVTAQSISVSQAPDGQAKLNVNSPQATVQTLVQRAQITPQLAAQIVQRRTNQGPFTSISQVLQLPGVTLQTAGNVIDRLSVGGQTRAEGRLNLNTVKEEVLNTFEDLQPDVVEAILSRQSTGFNSVGELANIPGMTVTILGRLADRLAVNSQVFIVRIVGEAGTARHAMEVVVNIEGDAPKIIRSARAAEGYVDRWLWPVDPSEETTILEAE